MVQILISIILVVLLIFLKKTNKINNFKYGIISIIFISFICELTIFNINCYRLKFSKYEEKTFDITECELQDFLYDSEKNEYIMNENSACIILDNLNIEIGTIYINGEVQDIIEKEEDEQNEIIQTTRENKIEYQILYTDKTSENYRELDSKVLVNSLENSKYTTCYLSGESPKVAIKFYGEKGNSFKFDSIILNKDVPFELNIPRILFLISIVTLIYSLKKLDFWNLNYKDNESKATDMFLLTLFIFIVLNICISQNTIVNTPDFYCDDFSRSIINKKFYLEKEPSEKLLKLENPYDSTVRSRDICEWDSALFEGKYYIYFGILPQLILFVPYMLITKRFLTSGIGVLIFSIFALFFLGLLLFEILKKWFKDIPLKLWFFAEIILLSGSVIFNLIGRPMFYEVLPASGLCFASIGIFFAFNFFILNPDKYRNLFLACSFLALSVACRPTMLLVSLIIMLPILKLFITNIKEKKNIIKTILSICIPYLTIGSLLMIYNYIRFKNPFEFGTIYQLTVNDMGNLKYRLLTIPAGLVISLFKIPRFVPQFPFIVQDSKTISFFGYFYTEDNIGGLFMLVPICFAVFFLPKLRGKFEDKKLEYIVKAFIIVGLLMCCLSIYNAGVLQRYLVDYAWLLIIASLIIILTFYKNFQTQEMKAFFTKFIGYITIFVFFVNLMSGVIVGEKDYMKEYYPKAFYNIRYSICFWE